MRPDFRTGRPASATHAAVALCGFLGFLLATGVCLVFEPFGRDVVVSCAFIIAVAAAAIAVPDLALHRVHLRASTGLDFARRNPSWQRTGIKLLGLAGSAGFIGVLYLLLPEYGGSFYRPYYRLLELILPFWMVAAVPYFYWIDRHMRDPADGYLHMGRALLGRWREVDRAKLLQHALGWMIKGFFMPLMFVYLCGDLERLWAAPTSKLSTLLQWHDLIYQSLFMIDVGLVCVGYLFSLRILDSHLRSAEPTLLGWLVALVCYEPFWSFVGAHFLRYWSDFNWTKAFADHPTVLALWSVCILALSAIYVWATIVFGARFSNLTHRGIITNGPYRFTKHPAYISKNLSWWLISLPFMAAVPFEQAVQNCLLLLGVNAIYFLRAKTEERHLGRDAVYVEYARWIDQHGLFRFVRRLPGMRFAIAAETGLARSQ